MRFLILLAMTVTLPMNAFAGSDRSGTRDGFHQYCVTKAKRSEKFCKCTEDFNFQAAVDRKIAGLENGIEAWRKSYEVEKTERLKDPSMTMDRINKICDVADEYYVMVQEYPLKSNGSLNIRKMTQEQGEAFANNSAAIKRKVQDLHNEYGSTDRTKLVISEAGAGYCMARTVERRLEKEFEEDIAKAKSDDVVIDYRGIVSAPIKSRGACFEFFQK